MYLLASLLLQLDAEDEAAHLLAADALYRLGRLQEAHQALRLALTRRPQAAPVLARLALLQLRRGCLCDASQVRAPLWVECAGTAWGLGVAPHAPPQAPAGPQPLPCVLPHGLSWEVVGADAHGGGETGAPCLSLVHFGSCAPGDRRTHT